MFMILLRLLIIPLLLLRRLRRLRRLCRRRRGRRRRLLLYHIPQRDEDRKHGDPGFEDPRSGRVGGCPEGLTIIMNLGTQIIIDFSSLIQITKSQVS